MDNVNKPNHYQAKDGSGLEVYDIIKAFRLTYDMGNVVKYLLRHDRKNGLEDLKKAAWYLDKIIQEKETFKKEIAENWYEMQEAIGKPASWHQLTFKFEDEA
jgi:Protein of unknwon function (DUF3310)